MRPARFAWPAFALAVLLAPAGLVESVIAGDTAVSFLFSFGFAAVALTAAGAGAVLASRVPRNPVGWILLGLGVGMAIRQLFSSYGAIGNLTASGPLPGDDIAAWVGWWMFVPVVVGGVVFLLHLFPDGRFMSRSWRLVGSASAAGIALITVGDALEPGPVDSIQSVDNPVVVSGVLADVVDLIVTLEDPVALPIFAAAVVSIVVRVRRSVGVQRQQLKWFSYTLSLVIAAFVGTALFPNDAAYPLLFAVFALAAMPVALGIAVLRYRLYDIDVVINRTLVYAALTALLAGTYLSSILLLQALLSGVTADNGLAIAGSTLAVAALFQPLRARVQAGVDRRFYRRKYDAARTLERFALHLRDEVDLDTLAGQLWSVVAGTMQPAHVSLWLRDAEQTR